VGGRRLTRAARDLLHAQLGEALVACDSAFDAEAKIKDAYELGLIRQATDIAERAYAHMLEVARPGMTEYELCAEIVGVTRRLGADDNFLLMASSQHNSGVRPPMDRRLDAGDFIIIEITPSVAGQFVQICRTAVLGEPSPAQQRAYALDAEAMNAGIGHGRPGLRVKDVVQQIDAVLGEAGYAQYITGHRRGHGFGLGSPLPGDISRDNEMVLEPGMSFVVHPNQYLPETGYVLCGEPVIVTEAGLEPIVRRPASLDVLPV
jgi:Xaa-Pro aminopeptidase